MSHYDGGYLLTKAPLLMSSATAAHTSELPDPVSQIDLDAINALQATPWRINRRIHALMEHAWAHRLPLPAIPVSDPIPVPPRLQDDAWAAMTAEARSDHRARQHKAHSANASARGQRQSFLDRLGVATWMKDDPSMWFPHARDFRGRVYPMPTSGPHPQGDDVAKSLIEFAVGRPLGPDGLYWLCIRAANTFGMDKLPLPERVEWALSNEALIHEAAEDPMASEWWRVEDEPWQFLATCFELSDALARGPDRDGEFVSHLPIPLDG